MDINAVIKNSCFNCLGEISSSRLEVGLPCEKDITENDIKNIQNLNDDIIYEILKKNNRLLEFDKIYKLRKEVEKFYNFFYSALNSEPWSIQVSWFRRLLRNESFSILAPTGTGKSTFIILSSLYLNKKICIILPTTLLVRQTYERITEFANKMKINKRIVAYLKENKKEAKKAISSGDFDILIISNNFLSKNFEILKDKRFDIIFVDDVDAFFKGSKNIERVLQLIGFSQEDIDIAKKVINLKLEGKFDPNSDIGKKIEEIKKKEHGILILSSATGSIRGKRTRLYRELLNFGIGAGSNKMRNIIDVYIETKDFISKIYEIVEKLKDGILIFVSLDYGQEYAKEIYEFLNNKGIKVGLVLAGLPDNHEKIKKFADGEINVLIGMAHPYGILVRGLDLPTRCKYAIFVGIPKLKINISNLEKNIANLIVLGDLIKEIVSEEERKKINNVLNYLKKSMKRMSSDAFRMLSEAYSQGKEVERSFANILNRIKELEGIIIDYLSKKDFMEKLKNHPNASLIYENDKIFLLVVDMKTYIQASGRLSRLYAGGITKGLSIVLVDDKKLLSILDKKLRLMFY